MEMKPDLKELRQHRSPTPVNEFARLQALRELGVLDTPAEEVFDAITRQAALICDAPLAVISLIDQQRQWFKSVSGIEMPRETPRNMAFCAHTILGTQPLEVPDTQQDARFSANPMVTGSPHVRFYAGVPLIDGDGHGLGALCVLDQQPRQLGARQLDALRDLALLVSSLLESRKCAAEAAQLGQVLNQAFREIIVLAPHSLKVQHASDGALTNLGYQRADLPHLTLEAISCGYPLDQLTSLSLETASGTSVTFEAQHVRRDGSVYPVEVHASLSSSQVAPQVVLLANDISGRRIAEDSRREMAARDGITQLPNRQSLEMHLLRAMQHSRRTGTRCALVMVEIERLPEIRRGYGQAVMQKVLAEFAARLRKCVTEADLVAHLGGDEFAIMINSVSDTPAVNRLMVAIQRSLDLPFHWELSQFFLGANVGAVYFGDADESVDALIGRASDAVNEAALSGAHHRISESADRPPARIAPKYNLPRSVAH